MKGKDNVVKGVTLRHKGHLIERPLQAVCPLEIRSDVDVVWELPAENVVADKAENTGRVKLKLHDAIYRLRFHSKSLIHILSLSKSHNNITSIQKNRGDKSHRVIVALSEELQLMRK